MPGLKVVAPATPYDAKGILKSAIRDGNPVVYFEHKRLYRSIKEDLPEGDFTVPIGVAEIRKEGGDLSIITYGGTLGQSLDAARIVEKEDGLAVEVLDLRTLLPLDREAILATARKTGKVLVVHEDRLTGGIGGEVSAIIMENAFEYLDGPVRRVAAADRARRVQSSRSRTSSCRAPTRSWTRFAAWRRIEMAIDVTMPQMGESVVEGTITKWLVKEGDVVIEDQPLVEISTDKVDTEIPSPGAGRIAKIVAAEGQTLPVGATIAVIEPAGAEAPAKLKVVAPKAAPKPEPARCAKLKAGTAAAATGADAAADASGGRGTS